MVLMADYHTHTVFSHGKGQIIDNANSAKDANLSVIGISDHGFSHPAFGLTKRKLPIMKKQCEDATEKTKVKVLLGIESNVIGTDGTVDLKEKDYDSFDLFLAGFHKFILFKPNAFFSMFLPDMFHSYIMKNNVPKSVIDANTRTFINAIKKNPIDMITHLNFFCFADVVEVAKAAADYGTYIELNAKKVHFSDEEIYKLINTGANFLISSDAHSPSRVGEISLVENLIKRTNFPLDRIHNIDGRLPSLRFSAFKERKL